MSETIIEHDGKRFKMVAYRVPKKGDWILLGCDHIEKATHDFAGFITRPILLPLEEEPPKEKRKVMVSGWVNMYADGVLSRPHPSRERADASAKHEIDRIACIHIEREVEEGEGLVVEPPKPSLLEAAKEVWETAKACGHHVSIPMLQLKDAIAREEASRG